MNDDDSLLINAQGDDIEKRGSVSLPQAVDLAKDTAEQEALVMRTLPNDVKHEVLAQLQAEERRYAPLQWLLGILFLVTALAVVYAYMPAPVKPWILPTVIEIETPDIPAGGPYSDLVKEAQQKFNDQCYAECAVMLAPCVYRIYGEGSTLTELEKKSLCRIPYLFLQANRRTGKVSILTPKEFYMTLYALEYARKAAELFQNEPEWIRLVVENACGEFLDNQEVYDSLVSGARRKTYQSDIATLRRWTALLRTISVRLEKGINESPGERKDSDVVQRMRERLKQIGYTQARLLVSLWMLEGGKGGVDFPDDEGDDGVMSRERALKLCLRPEWENCREFLQVRLFIAKKLRSQDSMINDYFWKGETYSSSLWLEKEIKHIEKRLNNLVGAKQ